MVGYDGFKHRNGVKVYVSVDEGAKSIALSPGNIHNDIHDYERLKYLETTPLLSILSYSYWWLNCGYLV